MTRKCTTIILISVGAVVLIYAMIPWNADGRFERRWESIQVGMTSAEVRKLLGSPDEIYPSGQVQSNSLLGNLLATWLFDSYLERWAYGSRSLADRFPILSDTGFWDSEDGIESWFAPKDEDYVIYFLANGKVFRKNHPYKKRLSP